MSQLPDCTVYRRYALAGEMMSKNHRVEQFQILAKAAHPTVLLEMLTRALARSLTNSFDLSHSRRDHALPEKIPQHIHDLTSRSDNSGDVQTNAILREDRAALQRRVEELEAEFDPRSDGYKQLRQTLVYASCDANSGLGSEYHRKCSFSCDFFNLGNGNSAPGVNRSL
jgi:hypothetical protein